MATSFYHVNVVVSDMDRATSFYQLFGFELDHSVRPVGEDLTPHLGVVATDLDATIMKMPGSGRFMLDLVVFHEPKSLGRPYDRLTNAGIARFSVFVDDFDSLIDRLEASGVDFFGPEVEYVSPLGAPMITRMAKNFDGTCVQVVASTDQREFTRTPGVFHINVVTTNMMRSKKFYEAIGFTTVGEAIPEAPGLGLPFGEEVTKMHAAFMSLGDDPMAPMLDLVEVMSPRNDSVPYPDPRGLGIQRFALWSDDLERDIERGLAAGGREVGPAIAFVGPEGVEVETKCLYDPDGTLVQFFARPGESA